MSFIESIMRILYLIESPRIAVKFLLGCIFVAVFLLFLLEPIGGVAEDYGIGPLPVYGFLALVAYALAVLIIEATLWLCGFVRSIRQQRARNRQVALERDLRTDALKRFLEHAEPAYKRYLRKLEQFSAFEFERSRKLTLLEKIGAIEEVVETRRNHAVFRLTSEAKQIVRDHFKAERESSADTLTMQELAFLQLFVRPQTEYENPERNEILPRETYVGGESLIRKHLVELMEEDKERNYQRWTLHRDAKARIEAKHGLRFARETFVLGLDRVQGISATGPGMIQSRFRPR